MYFHDVFYESVELFLVVVNAVRVHASPRSLNVLRYLS